MVGVTRPTTTATVVAAVVGLVTPTRLERSNYIQNHAEQHSERVRRQRIDGGAGQFRLQSHAQAGNAGAVKHATLWHRPLHAHGHVCHADPIPRPTPRQAPLYL